jgi:lipid-A-disaccharide synthase
VGAADQPRLLIVAGEASGDRHAARLVDALRRRLPCAVRGVTGPALERAGVTRIGGMAPLSVIGFTGVLARLPAILDLRRRVLEDARATRPAAAVLVDSPGFNFRIGPALRRLGLKVFYYIAPQVWAWHPERARAMAAWVDRLAVVFPFEEPLFREAGVDAHFVGHPLLEDLEPECDEATLRAELGVPADARLLGLLPGSRRQEVRAHLPILAEGARRLAATRRDLVAVVPLAPGMDPADVPAGVAGAPLKLVRDRTRAVMRHARACAVASGTATLETALFGTPLVVVYRTGALNYAIARRVVRLDHVGLPNIVAGEPVAPELLQGAFTPDTLAARLAPWLDDPAAAAAQSARLGVVRRKLEGPVASERAAELLAELIR